MCAHIVKRKNKHALNSQHNAPIHACTLNHVLLKPLLVETGFCPCDICSQIQNFKQTCLMMLEEPCVRPLVNETFLFEVESKVVKGIEFWFDAINWISNIRDPFFLKCLSNLRYLDLYMPLPFFLGCAYLQGPSTGRWVWNQILWNSKWCLHENVETSLTP